MVAMMTVVQLSIGFGIIYGSLRRSLCSSATCDDRVRIEYDSLLAGTALSAVISIMSLLHFMKCHRDHVLQLYRGKRTFSQNVTVSPADALVASLKFSGYQIAFTIAGFLVMFGFLTIIFYYLGLIINSPDLQERVLKYIISVLPAVVMAVIVRLLEKCIAFVFRNRDFPKMAITVDNRRLFSVVSYFFFFNNILVGFVSLLFRVLKGTLLGVFFLSRLDRTCLMHGFQASDEGFVAYLGFLDLLVAHSHPMMLVFCQLLVNRNKERGLIESTATPQSRNDQRVSEETGTAATVSPRRRGIPRVSYKAFNRWFVAVTLLRNPSLIQYRQQEGGKTVVRVESINVGFSDLAHARDDVFRTA
ncbi:stimulated by retinoic acid gene 6 protein-like [Montipora capricornis]